MPLLDFSLILFLCISISYFLINIYVLFFIFKSEKNKTHNSLAFFAKKILFHKFFSKYSFFTTLLGFGSFSIIEPIVGYILWLSLTLTDSDYALVPNIFIGFNIGFILIILIPILFSLIVYLKLFSLKKEFMYYQIEFFKNINEIELFNLEINNCIYAVTKNKYFQKKLNEVKKTIGSKKELYGTDLIKFFIKSYYVIDYIYNFLFCCKDELNLDFHFIGKILVPKNYHLYFRFCNKDLKKDLNGKEIYQILLNYFDCFEFIKPLSINAHNKFVFKKSN